jgi:hypothetical protein
MVRQRAHILGERDAIFVASGGRAIDARLQRRARRAADGLAGERIMDIRPAPRHAVEIRRQVERIASRSNHIKPQRPQRRSARSEKKCFSDGLCVLDVIFLERLSLSEYWDGWLYGLLDHRPKTTCFFQEFIAFLT